MFNKKSLQQICRQAVLIVPALALLLGSQFAWGQQQINKTFEAFNPNQLQNLNFVDGSHEFFNDTDEEFVDIALSGTDVVAQSGPKLLLYSGGVGPATEIFDFGSLSMRDGLTLAIDPVSNVIYAFFSKKGKPTHKLFVGQPTGSWTFGDVVAEDFPKFIDSVTFPIGSAVGAAGGVLAADGKAVYALEAPDYKAVRVANKKRIGLGGSEHITGLALVPGTDNALVATDWRRIFVVDLAETNPALTVSFEAALSTGECVSMRDQHIGVATDQDLVNTVVLVTDFACGEARLFNFSDPITVLGQVVAITGPLGGAVAEGIPLDTSACESGCGLDPEAAVTVTTTHIAGQKLATVYHVTGGTDCRCTMAPDCPTYGPNLDALNLTEIAPEPVRSLMPEFVLVPGFLQGHKKWNNHSLDCRIEFFFVDTDDTTITSIVQGSTDVQALLGDSLGCRTGIARNPSPDFGDIFDQDAITYIPTFNETACPDCDGGIGFGGTLANAGGCGSTSWRARGFSVNVYGTAIQANSTTAAVNVTQILIDDLGKVLTAFVQPLLSDDPFLILQRRYNNAVQKWNHAKAEIIASNPNSGDTNLQSVVSQFRNLITDNKGVVYPLEGLVYQNEVEVRSEVLIDFIEQKLDPAVPL